MAFDLKTCLDDFYVALGKSSFDFEYHCQNKLFPQLKEPFMRGGPSREIRRKIVQDAIDSMQIYGQINTRDAADKRFRYEKTYRNFFSGQLPPNTPGAGVQVAKLKLIEAKFYVLEEKFKLLDYWQAVAIGQTEPDYPSDGAHWAMHEFLQFDPLTVRPVLQILLDDAASVLRKQRFSAEMNTWKGAEYQAGMSFTRSGMSRTVCFDASARAGVEMDGKLELQYSGLKVQADAALFAGARGSVEGNVDISQSGFSAEGKVEAELAIHFKANVNCDVFDVLEVGAELDTLAGAIASAEAECTIDYQGISIKVGAEAFAGVRVTAAAQGTLKLGGREITTAKIEGSASAGAGLTGSAQFKCGILGNVSFGAKAGAAAGVGGEVGTEVSVDIHNIKWGATNLFWVYVNEHGFKNKGKVWFLPVEENVQMAIHARDALFTMMGDLYLRNKAEADLLERWNTIERRVTAQF